MIRPHINLEVSNLGASIHFYNQLFNTEPSKLKADYANYRLNDPVLHLALVEKAEQISTKDKGGEHFGFEFFEEAQLDQWKARLKQVGLIPYLEEENVTCCYAIAHKFWLKDPDGNEWEFWFKTDDNGESLFTSNTTQAESTNQCCPQERCG
jgi:catechol-2,3-dioxygenase